MLLIFVIKHVLSGIRFCASVAVVRGLLEFVLSFLFLGVVLVGVFALSKDSLAKLFTLERRSFWKNWVLCFLRRGLGFGSCSLILILRLSDRLLGLPLKLTLLLLFLSLSLRRLNLSLLLREH